MLTLQKASGARERKFPWRRRKACPAGERDTALQQGPRPLHHTGRWPFWNTAPLGTQKPDDRCAGDDESQAPTLGHEDHPRLQAESHRRCLFLGRIEQLRYFWSRVTNVPVTSESHRRQVRDGFCWVLRSQTTPQRWEGRAGLRTSDSKLLYTQAEAHTED